MTAEDTTRRILLENAKVLDVKEGVWRNDSDVLIEGDRIREVGDVDPADEEGLTQIDCTHKFVLPGLFECHAHLALLTSEDEETEKHIMGDFGTTKRDKLEGRILKEFVLRGITQVRDMGGPAESLRNLKHRISSGKLLGPDIFYSGPMLEKSPLLWEGRNEALPGFTVAIDSEQDAGNIVGQIAEKGASLVKTFNKFDENVFKYLVGVAKEHNLPVARDPGATLFQWIPMDRAIDLGVKCFEHAKAPWPVVLKDDLKSEHDKLIASGPKDKEHVKERAFALGAKSISLTKLHRLLDRMLENDVYFSPTLHAFKHMSKQQSEESNQHMVTRLEVLDQMQCFFAGKMVEEDVKLLVGQDGLIPQFTFDEMRYLREIGLSELEIIRGATVYPAEWLGIADRFGSISPNRKANIVVLNENPLEDIENLGAVHCVLLGGKIAFREPAF